MHYHCTFGVCQGAIIVLSKEAGNRRNATDMRFPPEITS
nr:MAG TPA: hypothetical protein [Caudoviricetes sp.]